MTPNEATILGYMLKQGIVSDTQLQDQFCISSGILLTITRSLKTKLLIEQDGRCFRATEAAAEVLQERQVRVPFSERAVW